MARCNRCGRVYREPEDEQGQHPCGCVHGCWDDDDGVDELDDDEELEDQNKRTCPCCDGNGDVYLRDEGGNGMYWQCPACRGKGEVDR